MLPQSKKANLWITALVFLSAVALFVFSQLSYFDRDEIEFVHTAWLIFKGKVIYKDFFQHHHPLGYYFIIPFFKLYGETTSLLSVLRAFYFIILMVVCFHTYLISRFFLERCPSGRRCTLGRRVCSKEYRGFESLSLRQSLFE